MEILKKIFKYQEGLLYLFFGGCTILINIFLYYFFYKILLWQNIPANILAWIGAVLFAFFTNKVFVFNSKRKSLMILCKEIIFFFFCRIATGLLDLVLMYLGVDILNLNGLIIKIFSNMIVIILNYIASKKLIFKKEN